MEAPLLHLALVGTPNSGKTSLFNALTGSRQKVANYPGVTVERKAGVLQTASGHIVNLVDLPGTYSLRGRSPDEEITRDVVLGRLATEGAPALEVAARAQAEVGEVGVGCVLLLVGRRRHDLEDGLGVRLRQRQR